MKKLLLLVSMIIILISVSSFAVPLFTERTEKEKLTKEENVPVQPKAMVLLGVGLIGLATVSRRTFK